MIDIMLLGTGAMLPLPGRWLSSVIARCDGATILVDCGEGTQIAWKAQGWGFRRLSAICISHTHADHIAGLPGLLHTVANSGRIEPIDLFGPPGIVDVVWGLRSIAPDLPYDLRVKELVSGEQFELPGGLRGGCVAGEHQLPVLAYRFDLPRTRAFLPDRARELKRRKEAPMLIRRPADVRASEITPEGVYRRRRELIAAAGLGAIAAGLGVRPARAAEAAATLDGYAKGGRFSTAEKPNSFKEITTYNNYYEFGTDKYSPAKSAHKLRTRPWQVVVDGEVAKPRTFGIEEILKFPQEERIYRLRCVEGWSMVIPWIGFELNRLADAVQPTGNAKFVEFYTALQPDTMFGVKMPVLDWPYVEGLRIDEAMHPLTIMSIGLYGRALPNQNGAPVRLVVPWKYGFKSGKSIVRIRFTATQSKTVWEKASAQEYGFYSNVNPEVDHPRWSQATERRIGEFGKRKTVLFNGYAEVASLYAGMDLKKFF